MEYALGVSLVVVVAIGGLNYAQSRSSSKLAARGTNIGNPDGSFIATIPTTPTSAPGGTTPPPSGPSGPVHLGGLSGAAAPSGKSVTATITVFDGTGAPISGVNVAGTWTGGGTGGDTGCVTDSTGKCSVTRISLVKNTTVTFTVTGMSGGTVTYDSSANNPSSGSVTVTT